MKPKISIIVATGRNREIGAKNKLLWRIPEELRRFKEITSGHPIIMGRKTFESIGRVLPDRTNIIVTRDSGYKVEGAVIVHSLEEAIKKAQEVPQVSRVPQVPRGEEETEEKARGTLDTLGTRGTEIFIMGGAEIFEQALPLSDKLYVTLVDADFPEADSFFPEYADKFTKKVFEKPEESSGFKYKQSLKTNFPDEPVNFVYKFLELER